MTDDATRNDWFAADQATFGDRLTAARESQGLSMAQLAARLGVKLQTVQAWENDRSEPRANKLQMLAGLLSVSIVWLLTGEGDGLSEPASAEDLAQDATALLHDIRGMRTEMTRLATRMGQAEKRLRLILKEAM